jgi:hypothetical protein
VVDQPDVEAVCQFPQARGGFEIGPAGFGRTRWVIMSEKQAAGV